jgi:RNA polymerase sigma factor (sigma-70 family)
LVPISERLRSAVALLRRVVVTISGNRVSDSEQRQPSEDGGAVQVREALVVVASLPERQREMFTLRLGGYSYQEISQRTGATTRTVDRQLGRARRRFRA